MKKLFSIVTIIFLSIFISCSNNEKSVIESSNLNALDSIKAIKEDSILNEKRRLEDSIKFEDRKAFLRDSLEKDSIKKFDLNSLNLNYKYKVPSTLNNLINIEIESRKDNLFGDWGIASDNIYPIGWCKDGKFAYAIENGPVGESESWYHIDFFVLNLLKNQNDTIFSFSTDEDDDIKSIWKKENLVIDEILTKYNIVQFDSFELDSSVENFEKLTNYTTSQHNIFKEGVCGIIKNPFNNIDAIIRYEFVEGWGADPPDELHFYIFSNPLSH